MAKYAEAISSDYIGTQVAASDNVEPQELIAAPIRYADGRNNHWESAPDETRYL